MHRRNTIIILSGIALVILAGVFFSNIKGVNAGLGSVLHGLCLKNNFCIRKIPATRAAASGTGRLCVAGICTNYDTWTRPTALHGWSEWSPVCFKKKDDGQGHPLYDERAQCGRGVQFRICNRPKGEGCPGDATRPCDAKFDCLAKEQNNNYLNWNNGCQTDEQYAATLKCGGGDAKCHGIPMDSLCVEDSWGICAYGKHVNTYKCIKNIFLDIPEITLTNQTTLQDAIKAGELRDKLSCTVNCKGTQEGMIAFMAITILPQAGAEAVMAASGIIGNWLKDQFKKEHPPSTYDNVIGSTNSEGTPKSSDSSQNNNIYIPTKIDGSSKIDALQNAEAFKNTPTVNSSGIPAGTVVKPSNNQIDYDTSPIGSGSDLGWLQQGRDAEIWEANGYGGHYARPANIYETVLNKFGEIYVSAQPIDRTGVPQGSVETYLAIPTIDGKIILILVNCKSLGVCP